MIIAVKMKLRSGRIYTYKPIKRKIKKISKKKPKSRESSYTEMCCICCETYKKGEYVTSCTKSNLKKHSFHLSCILKVIQTSIDLGQKIECPYCRISLKNINDNALLFKHI